MTLGRVEPGAPFPTQLNSRLMVVYISEFAALPSRLFRNLSLRESKAESRLALGFSRIWPRAPNCNYFSSLLFSHREQDDADVYGKPGVSVVRR
jgi:hypothetical protein